MMTSPGSIGDLGSGKRGANPGSVSLKQGSRGEGRSPQKL